MTALVRMPIEETDLSIRRLKAEVATIARSGMVPDSFRKGQGVDEAALLHLGLTAHALGITNLSTALMHIYNVQGKMCISADLAIGVAEARGVIRWRVVETTVTSCTVEGFRCDWPQSWQATPTRIVYTTADATRAGLASKDMWKKYPAQMLVARAKKQLAKILAADVLTGLADPLGQALHVVADADDDVQADEVTVVVDRPRPPLDLVEDAEIVEDDVDDWHEGWRAAVKAAGLGAASSKAIVRFVSDGKAELSADLDRVDWPVAEATLDHIVEGRWHIADGRVVESAMPVGTE